MKLPYRAGDSFELPLGDGTAVEARILACGHHLVDIAVAGVPPLRVSDRALVLQRWRVREHGVPQESPIDERAPWIGPALAERCIATALQRPDLSLEPLRVHNHASFSDPRRVRIRGRGERFDASSIDPTVGIVEFSGVVVDNIEALAAFRDLRALRIARVPQFDLRALAAVNVSALSVESIADLRNVEALFERNDLQQLEMLDLWPCELERVMPLVELPHLLRCYVDIGGRRKNVELNRRARWAYPWPFDVVEKLGAA